MVVEERAGGKVESLTHCFHCIGDFHQRGAWIGLVLSNQPPLLSLCSDIYLSLNQSKVMWAVKSWAASVANG